MFARFPRGTEYELRGTAMGAAALVGRGDERFRIGTKRALPQPTFDDSITLRRRQQSQITEPEISA